MTAAALQPCQWGPVDCRFSAVPDTGGDLAGLCLRHRASCAILSAIDLGDYDAAGAIVDALRAGDYVALTDEGVTNADAIYRDMWTK